MDERHDVERADVGVLARERRAPARPCDDVDVRDRLARARQQGIGERPRRTGEREDRAVVVCVRVHVEQRAPPPPRTRRRSLL